MSLKRLALSAYERQMARDIAEALVWQLPYHAPQGPCRGRVLVEAASLASTWEKEGVLEFHRAMPDARHSAMRAAAAKINRGTVL